jgi:hypothetical protein
MEQPQHPERITMRTIWQGVLEMFNLERGLIQSTITLTKRPGQAIREYLLEDRQRLMPPFRYLIFMVAIGTFVTVQYFNSNPDWMRSYNTELKQAKENAAKGISKEDLAVKAYLEKTSNLFNNYFNLFILATIPIAALVTRWFFRRRFNYAEHLVVNSYIIAYLTVVYVLLTPILFFSDFVTLSGIYSIITLIYSVIVYKQVYQSPGIRGVFAALGVVIVYFLLYYIVILIVFLGLAIYEIAKKGG